jgi:hypothetical protein
MRVSYGRFVRLNKYYAVLSYCIHVKHAEETTVASQEVLAKRPLQVLEKIRENLEKLNEKMEVMIELQKHSKADDQQPLTDAPLDVMTLLSMPDHLRKTAMALCRLGRATADEIALQTHRARAVESAYLNQLVIMGHLKKERKGRKAYFYIDRENQE